MAHVAAVRGVTSAYNSGLVTSVHTPVPVVPDHPWAASSSVIPRATAHSVARRIPWPNWHSFAGEIENYFSDVCRCFLNPGWRFEDGRWMGWLGIFLVSDTGFTRSISQVCLIVI